MTDNISVLVDLEIDEKSLFSALKRAFVRANAEGNKRTLLRMIHEYGNDPRLRTTIGLSPIDKYAGTQFSWKNYAHGTWREYRVSELFKKLGYWTFRSQLSLGPADLICYKYTGEKPNRKVSGRYLVQVKMRKQPNRAEPTDEDYELSEFTQMAHDLSLTPIFVGNDEHGGLLFWEWLEGAHVWKEWSP